MADDDFPRAALALEGWDGGELASMLRANRTRDAAAGRTTEGPHRQDLAVTHVAKAQPAARGSTGEQKALLLGLVLAHAELVAERRGAPPILLLDEVAAHLDPGRRASPVRAAEGQGAGVDDRDRGCAVRRNWRSRNAFSCRGWNDFARLTGLSSLSLYIALQHETPCKRRDRSLPGQGPGPRLDPAFMLSFSRGVLNQPRRVRANQGADVRLAYWTHILTKFTDLGLSQPLLDALAAKNYVVPTPIQAQAIPTVLTGRDLLGIAQTGTGKTAAFMLPSLDRLANPRVHPIAKRVRMLVLAPTRELASQIAESARTYARNINLTTGVIFGGTAPMKSVREVARGLDVLVATPGRLLDLVDQRAIDLSRLEILVLDEADQMLDLGFIHALKRIVQLVPKTRQTLFFSATMPKAIKQLADAYLTNPAEVSVTPAATTVERIDQSVTHVNQAEKAALLTLFLQKNEIERTLVFSRTKHGADKIVRQLAAAGIWRRRHPRQQVAAAA